MPSVVSVIDAILNEFRYLEITTIRSEMTHVFWADESTRLSFYFVSVQELMCFILCIYTHYKIQMNFSGCT